MRTSTEPPTVVVGVDGSDASASALRWAVAETARRGGRVEAVYVYAIPSEGGWCLGGHPGVLPPGRQAVIESARRELARAIERAVGRPDPVALSATAVPDFSAADALVRHSRGADLLVVGTHRRGLIGRLFGSTASAVLRGAVCPVVVVPPEGWTDSVRPSAELAPARLT